MKALLCPRRAMGRETFPQDASDAFSHSLQFMESSLLNARQGFLLVLQVHQDLLHMRIYPFFLSF